MSKRRRNDDYDPNIARRKRRKTSYRFTPPRMKSIELRFEDNSPAQTLPASAMAYLARKKKEKTEIKTEIKEEKRLLPDSTCDEVKFRYYVTKKNEIGREIRKLITKQLIEKSTKESLVTNYKEGVRFMRFHSIKHDWDIQEEYMEDRGKFWDSRATKLLLFHFDIEKWGFKKEMNLKAVVYEIEERDGYIFIHYAVETFWRYFYRITYKMAKIDE